MGFIQPTSSPHGVLVLFIKKRDGLLCLCIDFYNLDYISKIITIYFYSFLIYKTYLAKLKYIQR